MPLTVLEVGDITGTRGQALLEGLVEGVVIITLRESAAFVA
jgi:hypothetical protein